MSAADSTLDLPRLLDTAGSILDAAVDRFVDGQGAPSAINKGGTDFATQVDLDLERHIGAELADRTQIPVHGEEFGGADVVDGRVAHSVLAQLLTTASTGTTVVASEDRVTTEETS